MKIVSVGFVEKPYWIRRECIEDAVAHFGSVTTSLSLRYSFEDEPRNTRGGIVSRNIRDELTVILRGAHEMDSQRARHGGLVWISRTIHKQLWTAKASK